MKIFKIIIITLIVLIKTLNLQSQTDENQARMRGNVSYFEISQAVRYRTVLSNEFYETKEYIKCPMNYEKKLPLNYVSSILPSILGGY